MHYRCRFCGVMFNRELSEADLKKKGVL